MAEDNSCQSLGRIYTFLVIIVLTLISLFATLLHREERHATKHNIRLYPRQLVLPTPFAAPNSSSVSEGIAGITLASIATRSSSLTTTTTAVASPQLSGTNSSSSTGVSSSSTLSSSDLFSQTSTSLSTTSTSAVSSSSSAASSTSEQYSTRSIAAKNPSDYTPTVYTSTSTGMSPISPSNSAMSTSTSSKSRFWNNKGAVAGTFLFVSLFVVAVVAFLAFKMCKRRRNRRALEVAGFMTTLRDSKTGSVSPSLSLNDSPMDPFARREVAYHNVPIDPPNQSTSHPSEPKRYVPPSHLRSTPAAAQRGMSEVRNSTLSAYQPSFDSFYGVYSPNSSPAR